MSNDLRKLELEAKRAKLEEMRKTKNLPKTVPSTPITPQIPSVTTGSTPTSSRTHDADEILRDVGITSTPSLPTGSPSISSAISSSSQQKHRPPTNIALQICQQSTATVSVPPKELVTYSKEVQTIESGEKDPAASPTAHDHLLWDDEFPPSTGERNRLVYVSDDDTMSYDDNTKPSMAMSLASAHELKRTRSLKQQNKQLSLQGQTSLIKQELSNDEREQILKSEPFQDFFSRTSRLIERSLWESPQAFDIFKDYSGRDLDGQNKNMDVGEIIKFDREFFDERWTRHRIVTCIDTSTYHPELVLASYSQNDESTHESDGVVLIWNTKYKSKPTPEVRISLF
jgi:dynein intermediate chain